MTVSSFDGSKLASLFEESEKRTFGGQPLRLTGAGIWLATPFDVLYSASRALARLEVEDGIPMIARVLDAGMGDGRLVASLVAEIPGITVFGIESHPELADLAKSNLRRASECGLNGSWCVCQGDYLNEETYRKLGVPVRAIDAFFNYPDGNEERLGALLAKRGRAGALLVLLTPDHSARINSLRHVIDIRLERAGGAPDWRLNVFRVPA
jgi:hypothetical protein